VAEELRKVRDDHADPRRTEIQDAATDFTAEDMIADEDVAISITHTGYIKRTAIAPTAASAAAGAAGWGCAPRKRTSSISCSSPAPTPTS
jgi:DNA gyrase subunit A